jgi:hypothetical protein
MARGILNWSYPNALYVRTAVWQAEAAGVLPPRVDSKAKDLFAFNRVLRTLDALGTRLSRDDSVEATTTRFSLVLIDSMMWSSFESGPDGFRVLKHVEGPARGDVVIVTDSKVVGALAAGRLEFPAAEALGLVRLYGDRGRMDTIRHAFAGGEAGGERLTQATEAPE